MGCRLSSLPPAPVSARFDLLGTIEPLAKASVDRDGYRPSRPLGGWLATYGRIGQNGAVIPVEDRQGHIFEAARTLGMIDFSRYLTKGRWNDTHQGYTPDTMHLPKVFVGVPTGLEFHDEHTELAKAHRKVGFWTEGHLFDRNDPRSWTLFTDYEPTESDLNRSDYYWNLATMLKGVPRPLGFSAQGKMLLSPCGKRIIWAQINENAVCEVPQNPDATAQPLALAVPISGSMVGASPCDSCRCPPGARCPTVGMAKGINAGTMPGVQDLEQDADETTEPTGEPNQAERLVRLVMQRFNLRRGAAVRLVRTWVAAWKARQQQQQEAR